MKRSFLAKLHTNGIYYLVGALLLLIGVPLYQFAILNPEGYNAALATVSKGTFATYLLWLNTHPGQFLGYRILLIVAFALLLSLPFTLFRIIVAQEILGQEGEEQKEQEVIVNGEEPVASSSNTDSADTDKQEKDGMPPFAWRGRGFAVIAAWAGLGGVILFTVGAILSTLYLFIVGSSFNSHEPVQGAFSSLSGIFDILTYTVGGGLLAVALLLRSHYRKQRTPSLAGHLGGVQLSCYRWSGLTQWQCRSHCQCARRRAGNAHIACYSSFCALGSLAWRNASPPQTRTVAGRDRLMHMQSCQWSETGRLAHGCARHGGADQRTHRDERSHVAFLSLPSCMWECAPAYRHYMAC